MKPWKKMLQSDPEGRFRKRLLRVFQLPNGEAVDFEIKAEPDRVCVLPLTANRDVILVRQFRPGPELVLMELPGGFKDADEHPMEAAFRELVEETGYTGELQAVGPNVVDAYSTSTRYNFVATNCRRIGDPTPDAEEFIEVVLMPLPDFIAHLRSGQLTDVGTGYMGLHLLNLLP